MSETQVIALCSAVAVLIVSILAANLLRATDRAWGALIVGVPLIGLLAVPRDLWGGETRWLIGGGLLAALLVFSLASSVLTALRWLAAVALVSSGAFFAWLALPVVLIGYAVGALFGIGFAAVRMRSLRLATSIRHDGTPRRVSLGGTTRGPVVPPPPGAELAEAVWWAAQVGQDELTSGRLVLDSPSGKVVVDGAEQTFDFRVDHWRQVDYTSELELYVALGLSEQEARAKVDKKYTGLGSEARAKEETTAKSYTVHWLPADQPVYVIGVPDWEQLAEDGGYRDSPWVPVFRKTTTRPHLVDRPIQQARRDAWFDVFAWTLVALASAAIFALFVLR